MSQQSETRVYTVTEIADGIRSGEIIVKASDDLTKVGQTADSVIFEGSLAACRRLAFAHGMEVERYEGRTISIDGRHAVYAPADEKGFSFCWFKGGGLIHKARDGFVLVMPIRVWLEA